MKSIALAESCCPDDEYVVVEAPMVLAVADPLSNLDGNFGDGSDDASYDYCDDVCEAVPPFIGQNISFDDSSSYTGAAPQALDEEEEQVFLELAMSSSIMKQITAEEDEDCGTCSSKDELVSPRIFSTKQHFGTTDESPSLPLSEGPDSTAAATSQNEVDRESTKEAKSAAPSEPALEKTTDATGKTTEKAGNGNEQEESNFGSRLTNKKRRKQMKRAKKAAAAAAAAATLVQMTLSQAPMSRPIRHQDLAPDATSRLLRRARKNKQVACASQALASYRVEMKKQRNSTNTKFVR